MKTKPKITTEMRAFLEDFADLLFRYGVDVCVREDSSGYESYAEGVDIDMNSQWDKDGNTIREACTVQLSMTPDAEEILRVIKEQPTQP